MEILKVAGVTGYPPLITVVDDAVDVIKIPALNRHKDVST
jgi:hypothetical protein